MSAAADPTAPPGVCCVGPSLPAGRLGVYPRACGLRVRVLRVRLRASCVLRCVRACVPACLRACLPARARLLCLGVRVEGAVSQVLPIRLAPAPDLRDVVFSFAVTGWEGPNGSVGANSTVLAGLIPCGIPYISVVVRCACTCL